MNGFLKYLHLERYGTDGVDGITLGECHIFPKLDGTNASFWCDSNNVMHYASRNRELSIHEDNAGFVNWAITQDKLTQLAKDFPNHRFYGEWLVPHSVKGYRDDAWRQLYLFDVLKPDGTFMHYDEYSSILQERGINFIPCACKATNPSYEQLIKLVQENKFLMVDGQGFGEGVVIKQYGWVNRFGDTTWAKLISNTFKEAHIRTMGGQVTVNSVLEEEIVDEFVTPHLVEKTIAKIRNTDGKFEGKSIPKLLGLVYYDLIVEEMWEIVKKHKNPKIDFKTLNHCVIAKVKQIKPELFGRSA